MKTAGFEIAMVEDDPEVRRLVGAFLEREGFGFRAAGDGGELDAILAVGEPDLIVLDLMLPGEDGLSICRRLRATSTVPILMLTAKSDEIDRIVGLEVGADDYLAKPFAPRELLARIRAILRRARPRTPEDRPNRYAVDAFLVDFDSRSVETVDGRPVVLTSAEFDLLACFAKRPRRVLSRETILDWVHGRNADPFDRSVDMLVSRLRKKLDQHGGSPNLITTVRNSGYMLTARAEVEMS
jgi:two-component system, OmpR family, response regulator